MTQRESDLYPPIKSFLEGQGYEVKGEVGPADVVARRGKEEPVIVEMKRGFSLALFHQGIARLKVSERVYLAVPLPKGGVRGRAFRDNLALARRLGLGVITVRARDGFVAVHAEPGPYAPRKSKRKAARLLTAFDRLTGDPNAGGSTRHGLVTGYRQDALRCARYLGEHGPSQGAKVAAGSGVPTATRLMADNHYGWFARLARGVYGLTAEGRTGLADWGDQDL